jgi:hypothetical protein
VLVPSYKAIPFYIFGFLFSLYLLWCLSHINSPP